MGKLQELSNYLGVKISDLQSLQNGYIPCKSKKWFTLTMKEHGRECSNMILTPNSEQIWYAEKNDGRLELFMQFEDAKYPIGNISKDEFDLFEVT